MSTPHNTSRIDPLLLLADAMGPGGPSAAIENMERQGQQELVNSTVIPAKINSGSEEDLAELGFTLGDPVENDALFRHAELPAGWKREGADHAMWSHIVDEQGRPRISIFYKAAFYDRKAFLSVKTVTGYISSCLYENTTPVLDETWATREAVLAALERLREEEQEQVDLWSRRPEPYAAEYAQEARDRTARIDALRARLADDAAQSSAGKAASDG